MAWDMTSFTIMILGFGLEGKERIDELLHSYKQVRTTA
jgi:hypothetical protein